MDKLLKQLKDNWIIYGFIITLVLWYGSTNSRLDVVEAKAKEQQTTLDKIEQLAIDMAVVKNDVQYIKKEIQK